MTARLSTHVLDTSIGRPAAGMTIALHRWAGVEAEHLLDVVTNADGRTDAPLLVGEAFAPGTYELRFAVGAYFAATATNTTVPPFLDIVPIRFGADGVSSLHVPLLVTPWSYSTYRGS